MDTPVLLLTKLAPPPARPDCICRQRLFERLDGGVARRLTLVAAPAGYGKTTLLSSWYSTRACLQSSQRTVAFGWVSLEAADNEPVRFWTYVVRALQTALAHKPAHPLLALEVSPLASTDTFVAALLNACAVSMSTADEPTILVLDDYHLITNPVIHTALAFLLEHLPPNLHLVIASRTAPPLPLTKLRAEGQLAELRAADLRFSREEMASVLHIALPLSFGGDQIAHLREQTDGWILPLHLAALAWQGRTQGCQDTAAFVASVSAEHHAIVEYLAAEVLAQQPADIQRFLMATALLSECCGALCDALLRRTDSQRVLAQLEHDQLFLGPCDETHRWYRYHPLFATFLQSRASEQSPDEIAVWHRRAADWYLADAAAEFGAVEVARRALPHLITLHDWTRVAALIEGVAQPMLWQRGEARTLLQWLEEIPTPVHGDRPPLALARAWALTLTGQFDAAESALVELERVVERDDTQAAEDVADGNGNSTQRKFEGEILAVRARIAAFHDVEQASVLTGLAIERLPEDDNMLRADLLLNLGYAQFRSHDYVASSRTFQGTRSIGMRSGNLRAVMLSSRYLAFALVMQGRLNDAATIYRQALRLAARDSQMPPPVAGTLYIGNAQLLYERNDLDAALDHAQRGLALGMRSGEMKTLLPGYLTLAQIHQGMGDVGRASQALDDAERLSDLRLFSWTEEDVAVARARLQLLNGEVDLAVRALSRNGWQLEGPPDTPFCVCPLAIQVAWARVHLAQHRPDNAVGLLRHVLDRVRREQPQSSTLPLVVLQTLALSEMGEDEQALVLLADVLPSAFAQGYVRAFLDEGAPMASLLRQLMHRHPVPGCEGLLAAFPDLPPEDQPSDEDISASATVLSPREVEVMRLMATGLSNQQIADHLVVGVSTVRTHTKHIYRKLSVHGRVRAIARARSLHVL